MFVKGDVLVQYPFWERLSNMDLERWRRLDCNSSVEMTISLLLMMSSLLLLLLDDD
jgi:hypothetical protein